MTHRIPFIPGGPLDLVTILGLYGILRWWGHPRRRAIVGAVRIEWAAWRYSYHLQHGSGE